MNRLFLAAQRLQAEADSKGWRLMFIGGIALQRWGEPRLTVDVDASVFVGFDVEPSLVESIVGKFKSRVPNPLEFATNNRVILLESDDGIGIDIALAAFPYEEDAFRRSSVFEFLPDVRLRTLSGEDLVIMKSLAGREKDWLDVRSVAQRQGQALDWDLILNTVADLQETFGAATAYARLSEIRATS